MSVFQECWDRIDRADLHAKTLVDGLENFLGDKAYKVVPQLRDKRYGSLAIQPLKTIDRTFAFELGEYFYQLRAALDSAMWIAYETWGLNDPAANLKQLYFPIVTTKKRTFEDATFQAIKLPNKLSAWLRSVQPCCADERTNGSDEEMMSDTLLAINGCASFDRHRKLHLVGGYVTMSTPFVEVTPPATVIDLRGITTGDYFKGEFVVAEFTVEGLTDDTQIRGEGQYAITVSVDEIPKTMGQYLGTQLETMVNNTRFAVQQFDEAL